MLVAEGSGNVGAAAAGGGGAQQGGGGAQQGMPIPGVDPYVIAQADAAYQRALAAVQGRRRNTMTSYGFMNRGYDASGNPIGLAVDPHSMYGKYQQMLDAQAHASMDAEDQGMAAGFTGGLANRGVGELLYQQGGQRLALSQGMLGELSAEEQDLINAQNIRDQMIMNAWQSAAASAAANGDYTPASEQPYSGGSGAGASVGDMANTARSPLSQSLHRARKQSRGNAYNNNKNKRG